MSLQKDCLEPPPIYFLNNPLEVLRSFKLLGFTICHDFSWKNHISKLSSKDSHQLGILCHAKSILGTRELLTMHKAFICTLKEYCSPLFGGAPASHLAQLHAVEAKVFRIIVSPAMKLSLWVSLFHQRQVGGLCLPQSPLRPCPPALSVICPPPIFSQGAQGLPKNPFW